MDDTNRRKLQDFKKVLSFIINSLSPIRISIFFMVAVALFCAFDFAYRRYLMKNILDAAYDFQGSIETIVFPIALFVLMSVSLTTIYRLYGFILDVKAFPFLKQKISDTGYWSLLNQDYAYYQDNLAGNLAHKLSNLAEGVEDLVKVLIDRFFLCTIILIVTIYTLSLVGTIFALATLLWVVLFVSVSIYCFRPLSRLSDTYSESNAKVTATAADTLFNMFSVKLFSNKRYERLKLFRICHKRLKSERRLNWAYWWLWFIYGYSFDFLQIVNFYFLINGFINNTITLGDFSLVVSLNVAIVEFFNQLTHDLTRFSDSYGKVSNSLRSIFVEPKIKNKKRAKSIIVSKGGIDFESVSFAYNKRSLLFNDLSVHIGAKEKIALVGNSGAGKSTFINLTLGLFAPSSGKILIDGQSIAEVNQDSVRKNISVVPQDLTLFHGTIYENIHYGNLKASKEKVIQSAKFAGAHDFISGLPNNYDTIVGEKGLKLSGGERQRLNIARAFLKNAPILILDEATNQLDALIEEEIQLSLLKLMQDKTTLVIAHRLSTLMHMDRILVFDQGHIIQEGLHTQLIQQPGHYQELWGAETKKYA